MVKRPKHSFLFLLFLLVTLPGVVYQIPHHLAKYFTHDLNTLYRTYTECLLKIITQICIITKHELYL